MGSFATTIVGATKRYPTAGANVAAASAVVTTSPARLYSVSGYSSGATYILIFDATSLPAEGETALLTLVVNGGQFYFDLQDGLLMSTGIVVCNSSTAVTKTIGSADTQFVVGYRNI